MGPAGSNLTIRWRRRFYRWSDTWPKKGPLVSGRHRSRYHMLRAGMALADEAQADGNLRGSRDWWALPHLTERMGFKSPNTGVAVLRWLEETGWIGRRAGAVTPTGRTPDMRWLTLPIPHESSSAVTDGPSLKNNESIPQESPVHPSKSDSPSLNAGIQPVSESVDPSFRRSVGKHLDIAAEVRDRLYRQREEAAS